jgi:hypothetical protein
MKRKINKLKPYKAVGLDEVSNDLIKICREESIPYLNHLTNACLSLSYHPKAFKVAKTIALRKPGPGKDYTLPKSWRPIALLSCVGKLFESVVASRFQTIALKYRLLPRTQMGCAGRSTETALLYILQRSEQLGNVEGLSAS